MTKPPRVALLIESSRGYGRGLLRGIVSYVRAHGPWSIYYHERALGDAAPAWMGNWHGDGIIARIISRKLIRTIEQLGLPTVDLRDVHELEGIPVVETEQPSTVRLAVDHLLERGFQHFAFCGFAGADYSEKRREYFMHYLAEAGHQVSVYQSPRRSRTVNTSVIEGQGLEDEDAVAAWLKSLPKPAGLMACNDVRGQQVLNACTEYGVVVPNEVAVVGVNNDELLCESCCPTLSSVEPNTRKIGYEAAALLDRMMKGDKPPRKKTFIKPLGVVTRESTDALVIQDSDVAAALHFIRQHACEGITIDDVLRHVPVSRSTLQRRFAKLVGRSPRGEIVRVQLQRTKELLTRTDFPLAKIAGLAGFNYVESMCNLFKATTGRTPGSYRKESREA